MLPENKDFMKINSKKEATVKEDNHKDRPPNYINPRKSNEIPHLICRSS